MPMEKKMWHAGTVTSKSVESEYFHLAFRRADIKETLVHAHNLCVMIRDIFLS